MQLEINRRADLSLDLYHRVAWHGQSVHIGIGAMRCMADCRAEFMRLIDGDPNVTVYGVTSGYGQFASKRLQGEARLKHARKPPRSTTAAFGAPAPERVARGIVLARLANFIEGHAAVSPDLAVEIARLLDGGRLPKVSVAGQGGGGWRSLPEKGTPSRAGSPGPTDGRGSPSKRAPMRAAGRRCRAAGRTGWMLAA